MRYTTRRIGAVAAGVATTALGVGLLTATPAGAVGREFEWASTEHWETGRYYCVGNASLDSDVSAYGCFTADGDHLQLGDAKKDGKRVAMAWHTSYGVTGICVNKHGLDFTFSAAGKIPTGEHACRPPLREGTWITFRVGTCDGDVHSCTTPSQYGQWSDPKKLKNDNDS